MYLVFVLVWIFYVSRVEAVTLNKQFDDVKQSCQDF